jgi:hypothetical protein
MIRNYSDFISELLKAGFSGAVGGNDEGVFGLFKYGWNNTPDDCPLHWHTDDPETDPWLWRMRVLDERSDIAYSKLFFKKAGYITKEWYPYFLSARRGTVGAHSVRPFKDDYASGTISHFAKRIFDVVSEHDYVPLDEIKRLAGFGREDKSKFDAALNELQMKLYITMCGKQMKLSQKGEEYGWASTMFCTTELFWGEEIFEKAANIDTDDAAERITEQVYKLNPAANPKKIVKFIRG